MDSVRFVVVRVVVEHDETLPPELVCEEVALVRDSEIGVIKESRVETVLTPGEWSEFSER